MSIDDDVYVSCFDVHRAFEVSRHRLQPIAISHVPRRSGARTREPWSVSFHALIGLTRTAGDVRGQLFDPIA